MDFRAYTEQKRKEVHKEIIEAICIETNNCADCYNEKCRRAECNPCSRANLFKVTENSFYIEPYSDSKTNRKLIDIATKYGYEAGLIMEGTEVAWIKFWK